MPPTPTARLFKLSPELWAKLEAIAAANGTLAATGPTAGQPSVHALLGAIAAGDLVVAPPLVECCCCEKVIPALAAAALCGDCYEDQIA